jgi:hypothetical protein
MDSFTIPVMIALVATVVVLFFGMYSMVKGGDYDRQHSVQLMVTRVSLQALAIILIIAAVLYASSLA